MEQYVRNRITQLRLLKGVSEYQMSYDLGHSRGYVYNISSGKAMPSMSEFFSICEYFNITPSDFFNVEQANPPLMTEVIDKLKALTENDILLLLTLINRFRMPIA